MAKGGGGVKKRVRKSSDASLRQKIGGIIGLSNWLLSLMTSYFRTEGKKKRSRLLRDTQ